MKIFSFHGAGSDILLNECGKKFNTVSGLYTLTPTENSDNTNFKDNVKNIRKNNKKVIVQIYNNSQAKVIRELDGIVVQLCPMILSGSQYQIESRFVHSCIIYSSEIDMITQFNTILNKYT
jgi:hypothetical protein